MTRTDFGAAGYGGPCPPESDRPHRTLFTVFAVGADSLTVKAATSPAVVGFNRLAMVRDALFERSSA